MIIIIIINHNHHHIIHHQNEIHHHHLKIHFLKTTSPLNGPSISPGHQSFLQEPLKRLCDDATFGTEMLSLASKEVTATESAATEVNVLFEHKVPWFHGWLSVGPLMDGLPSWKLTYPTPEIKGKSSSKWCLVSVDSEVVSPHLWNTPLKNLYQ